MTIRAALMRLASLTVSGVTHNYESIVFRIGNKKGRHDNLPFLVKERLRY